MMLIHEWNFVICTSVSFKKVNDWQIANGDKCTKNVDLNTATRMTEEMDLGESICVDVNRTQGSSCLHSASITFKHFIIQLMHQYIIRRCN